MYLLNSLASGGGSLLGTLADQVGDTLRTEAAKGVTILAIDEHAGYVVVYTLTVATDHDYFVGSAQGCGWGPPRGQVKLLSKGQIRALKKADLDIHEGKGTGPLAHFDLHPGGDSWIYQMLNDGRGDPEPQGIIIKRIIGV
jgi:hypothetical protein